MIKENKITFRTIKLTASVFPSGAMSLSWKHHLSTPSFFKNSKLALTVSAESRKRKTLSLLPCNNNQEKKTRRNFILLLLLAMANELVPSSQGQNLVGAPNGSAPVPRNVCQNAMLNLIQSCNHIMISLVLKNKVVEFEK